MDTEEILSPKSISSEGFLFGVSWDYIHFVHLVGTLIGFDTVFWMHLAPIIIFGSSLICT